MLIVGIFLPGYCNKYLSGIPQGSILGPVLFIIYINDLIESCGEDAKIYLFADDARLYNHIKCIVDAELLQSKNDKFTNWAHRWLVKLLSLIHI